MLGLLWFAYDSFLTYKNKTIPFIRVQNYKKIEKMLINSLIITK